MIKQKNAEFYQHKHEKTPEELIEFYKNEYKYLNLSGFELFLDTNGKTMSKELRAEAVNLYILKMGKDAE